MRLKELRESKSLLQKDIASAIFTTQNTISNWEKGITEPSIDFLIKLADYFQVSVDYLLGRENDYGMVEVKGISLTAFENKLLSVIRRLPTEDQYQVLGYAQALNK